MKIEYWWLVWYNPTYYERGGKIVTNKEIRNFMKQTCCPFLAARKGYWIGGDSPKEKSIKKKDFYLDDAYKYLKKQENNIKRGSFLSGHNYDRNNRTQIIDWASKAYDRKIEELEEILSNR